MVYSHAKLGILLERQRAEGETSYRKDGSNDAAESVQPTVP